MKEDLSPDHLPAASTFILSFLLPFPHFPGSPSPTQQQNQGAVSQRGEQSEASVYIVEVIDRIENNYRIRLYFHAP